MDFVGNTSETCYYFCHLWAVVIVLVSFSKLGFKVFVSRTSEGKLESEQN